MFSAFPPSDLFFQLLYTTEETKMWDKNLLIKFFFQSISKYFNSFEHPHFQPQCVRISFLGFCALNKKQI